MADALTAWQPIVDRIKTEVPALKAVHPVWDLASVVEQSQVNPAVFVVYDGEEPVDSVNNGKRVMEDQRFIIVLVVRNAKDVLGGSGARESAVALRGDVLRAVSGWQPTSEHRPLQRAKGSPPPHYTPGFAYLPTTFTTRSTNP